MRRSVFAALVAALLSGCVTYERGSLAAVSVRPLYVPLKVIEQRAEGRSCEAMNTPRYVWALEKALKSAPGANAILNVSFETERLCIVVRGTAVEMK